jgi:hypothetical protein
MAKKPNWAGTILWPECSTARDIAFRKSVLILIEKEGDSGAITARDKVKEEAFARAYRALGFGPAALN